MRTYSGRIVALIVACLAVLIILTIALSSSLLTHSSSRRTTAQSTVTTTTAARPTATATASALPISIGLADDPAAASGSTQGVPVSSQEVSLSWVAIEQRRGYPRWTSTDQQIFDVTQAHRHPILLLDPSGVPGSWVYDLEQGKVTPLVVAWDAFVRSAADRYGQDHLAAWEVLRAPNTQPQFTPANAVSLIANTYRILKTVDPRVPVWAGGLAPVITSSANHTSSAGTDFRWYLDQMYQHGLGGTCDGVVLRLLNPADAASAPEATAHGSEAGVAWELAQARQIIHADHGDNLPIEVIYGLLPPRQGAAISGATASAWLAEEAALIASNRGIQTLLLWPAPDGLTFSDGGSPGPLLYIDDAQVVAALNQQVFSSTLTTSGAGGHVEYFTHNGASVVMGWDATGSTTTTVAAPNGFHAVSMGQLPATAAPAPTSVQGGAISLSLSAVPVMVYGRQDG